MMKNKILIILLLIANVSFGQQLTGSLKYHAKQEIKLLGYSGFKTIELAKTTIDSLGNFTLNYTNYKGMGYLETSDKSELFVVLNEPSIHISGTRLNEPDSLVFVNSPENLIFTQYAVEHNQRENALSGWKYLLPLYSTSKEFKTLGKVSVKKEVLTTIQKEIERLEKEDARFLSSIDKSTYVSWFLPLRKLLDDIPLSAQRYTTRIPQNLAAFRKINFNDERLYHSGILDDLIESHYWLIENGGMKRDSMYAQMNISTDYLVASIKTNDSLLNEVTSFLFNLLEKRSLFKSSEYLALKMLTQSSCTLNDDLAKQLETYRAMKVGNIAKDILFTGSSTILKGMEIPSNYKLSTMNNKYTLVVFGASWCPKCAKEIPTITSYYKNWKAKGVEVVFISLDTEEKEFLKFVKDSPFLSSCDFQGWKTKAAQDYYVFATPTLFLLDKERKIVLRPSSIQQVDAWVNYKIN